MPGSKLVIVESPAKAKTIKNYLGDGFVVEASVGHVRDVPYPSELPPEEKKGPYGEFAVDIHGGFKPYYAVNPDKKKKVTELRRALKDADELFLATDEDREGEAIAWHLEQVLKPKVPVRRMVFHEITKEAIERALENTRDIDMDLVDAQETRRVLDRLFGFEVSPVLWRKIQRGLSAGRVQSPAMRLIVDRERERMAHVMAEYWSIKCSVDSAKGSFEAKVIEVGGKPVATGSDFGQDGKIKKDVVVLDGTTGPELSAKLTGADAVITAVTQKPYRRRPAAPFTTSTLQQEASRKLKWNAQTTMRMAQSLYESGHITYMRTDSTALSSQALGAAREQVEEQFGAAALPDKPRVYGKVAKGAQEAHEAIRPSGEHFTHPKDLDGVLAPQQLALYDLIWKRTLASQMNDVIGYTATVKLAADDTVASASGTVITDPGFRALYQEGRDGKNGDAEAKLPAVAKGDSVKIDAAEAEGHQTQPPGRYTEATLVKAMEELGIGRPSTYASTIETIGNRGYVNHRGQYLVPTWLAFAVTRLLEENLPDLVNYDFTAEMEGNLDQIAAGDTVGSDFLASFFFGEAEKGESSRKGLRETVASLGDIDAREVNTVNVAPGVTLRNGRYGPYLETEDGKRANVPPEVAPDEMNPQLAAKLLDEAASDGRELGTDPGSGNMLVVRTGRYGPYVTEVLPEADTKSKTKPKARTGSLFADMDPKTVTLEDALMLLSLPREVGKAPDGEVITAQNGPYGPYLKKGSDSRNLDSERKLLEITLEEALEIYSQPKQRGRRAAKPPLREFGEDPVSAKKVVIKDGRFGPYITDGTTNVTVPRAEPVETLTEERAFTLLADKRAKGPAPKKTAAKKTTAKKTAAKKAPAKKAVAKKAPAKKTTAKKTTTKKAVASKVATESASAT